MEILLGKESALDILENDGRLTGKPFLVFYVSRTGNVSSASEKRTSSEAEIYVFHKGNVENARTEGGLRKDVLGFYEDAFGLNEAEPVSLSVNV